MTTDYSAPRTKCADPRNGFADQGNEVIEQLIVAVVLSVESNWRLDHHGMVKARGPELVHRATAILKAYAFIPQLEPVGKKARAHSPRPAEPEASR